MFTKRNRFRSIKILIAFLLGPSLLAMLACSVQVRQNESLKETDIALSVEQTHVAEALATITAQAFKQAVEVSPYPVLKEAQPEITAISATNTLASTSTTMPLLATTASIPSVVSTDSGNVIYLGDWKAEGFKKANGECRNSAVDCWVNNMTAGNMKNGGYEPTAALISLQPVLIDDSWTRPSLHLEYTLSMNAFSAYVQAKVDGRLQNLMILNHNANVWTPIDIDLSKLKGKEVTIIFYSTMSNIRKASVIGIKWQIENIYIQKN